MALTNCPNPRCETWGGCENPKHEPQPFHHRGGPVLVIHDPHHDGHGLWRYHDRKLYQSPDGGRSWREARRVKFTPRRFKAIARLVKAAEVRDGG